MAENVQTQTPQNKWGFSASSFTISDDSYYAVMELNPEDKINLYLYLDSLDVLREYGQKKLRSLAKLFVDSIIEITIFEEKEFKPRAKAHIIEFYDKDQGVDRKILQIVIYRKNPMYDYEVEFSVIDYSPDAVNRLHDIIIKLANDNATISDLLKYLIEKAKEIVINY